MLELKHWSAFQWYDHLAVILFLSLGREDIINHIEALMKFTQQALNDSNEAISLLSLEVSTMRKVALQDWMVLDILTPSQREMCYSTEYWVFIPDESSSVTCLMTPEESIFPYKRFLSWSKENTRKMVWSRRVLASVFTNDIVTPIGNFDYFLCNL